MSTIEAVFDLDAFGTLDTVEYPVHRDGDKDAKIGLKLTLAGPAHPVYQEYIDGELRKLTKKQEEREKAEKEGKEIAPEMQTLQQLREVNAAPIAVRILSASAPIKFRGNPITLGPSNALTVLSDPHFTWLLVQVRDFLSENAVFTPNSAAS